MPDSGFVIQPTPGSLRLSAGALARANTNGRVAASHDASRRLRAVPVAGRWRRDRRRAMRRRCRRAFVQPLNDTHAAAGNVAHRGTPRGRSLAAGVATAIAAGVAYAAVVIAWLPGDAVAPWIPGLALLATLLILWRLRGARHRAAAMALQAGAGVLGAAVAGLAIGLPGLAGIVPDQTPLSLEGLLCMALLLAGGIAAESGHRRSAVALFVAAALPAAATLMAWLQVPPRGVPPPVFEIDWWLQQRMQPLHAISPLVVAFAGIVSSASPQRPAATAAAWLIGIAGVLAAMVSLFASAVGATESTIHLSHPAASVPASLALAAISGWLVLHDRRLRDGVSWLPLLAGSVLTAGALSLAWYAEVDRAARQQREAEAAANAAEVAIENAFSTRLASIEGLAQRLLSVSAYDRSRLFDVEAAQALRAGGALQSVARIDAQRRIRQISTIYDNSYRLIGRSALFDQDRAQAYDRAERSGRAVALGPIALSGTEIEAMLVIYPGPFGDAGTEFIVAGYGLADMVSLALDNVAPGFNLEATIDGQRRMLRGVVRTAPQRMIAATRRFTALDADWTVVAEPDDAKHAQVMPLSRAIVFAGMLVGVLVALALRLAAAARERAAVAEGAISALHAESAARASSEAALARSEQQAQRLLEGMSDGVLMLDHEFRISFANRRAREMIGDAFDDPVGLPVGTVFAHFEDSDFARGFREVIETRRSVAMEGYSPTIGRWLSGRVHPVDDGLTAIFDDVTEIRLAQAFERDQREVLHAIASGRALDECIAGAIALFESRFGSAAAAVMRVDGPTRRVLAIAAPSLPEGALGTSTNAPLAEDAGCCGAAVASRGASSTASIADDPRWTGRREILFQAGFRACWSQAIIDASGVVIGTFSAYIREAREASAAERAAADSVAALAGIAIERDLAALRVETERQRFRSLSERSPYMVYAFDVQHRLVDCNDNVVREGGFPREALLGMQAEALVLKPWRERVRRGFDSALRGESVRLDCAVLTAGHLRREVEVTLVPIAVDGSITGVFGVVRDTTDERRTAAELDRALRDLTARNQELKDFAFVASHDLQEPLRKVQAFSDRVIERYGGQLDAQGTDWLRRIDAAAHRMQVLIDDLLTYSRVTSQGEPFAPVDLAQVIRDVLSDLEVRIESSGATVEVGELGMVDGDRTQLRQLLQNLLANALKFRAADRAPRISVAALPAPDNDQTVLLVVEDNGIGFDPVYAERIFAPFQRLHGREEYEGTGIGLAIVRRIVERHRGSIRAEGQPGVGTRFEVRLPRRAAAGAA